MLEEIIAQTRKEQCRAESQTSIVTRQQQYQQRQNIVIFFLLQTIFVFDTCYNKLNGINKILFTKSINNTYISGQPVVVFRTDKKTSTDPDETYTGSLTNFDELYEWVQEKCIPLVREITFENAEELTEEGLPFLILFHEPTDNESVKRYKEVISRELQPEKRKFCIKSAHFLEYFCRDMHQQI